jgi:hypothetical protein
MTSFGCKRLYVYICVETPTIPSCAREGVEKADLADVSDSVE